MFSAKNWLGGGGDAPPEKPKEAWGDSSGEENPFGKKTTLSTRSGDVVAAQETEAGNMGNMGTMWKRCQCAAPLSAALTPNLPHARSLTASPPPAGN